MALEEKTRDIDGLNIRVHQFPALQAFRLQAEIIRTVAPAFGMAASGVSTEQLMDQEIDFEKIANAIASLADRLSVQQFESLVARLLEWTYVDNKKVADAGRINQAEFDVFSGRMMALYKTLAFVLEVNYPDFFGKLTGAFTGVETAQTDS